MRQRRRYALTRRAKKIITLVVSTAIAAAFGMFVLLLTRIYVNWENPGPALTDVRFFRHEPTDCENRPHPDLPQRHCVAYNRFGMRQFREPSLAKPPGAIRIGVFGDSFVENVDMAAPYSFTEPLDYLLHRLDQRFEVLNFGVYSFGPDQEYVRYLEQGRQFDLDVVVYVFYDNDVADICRHRWFDVDADGRPVPPPPIMTPNCRGLLS